MDPLFATLEVMAVVLAAVIMAVISQDGETNWMEGIQLPAVYIILGSAFFFFKGTWPHVGAGFQPAARMSLAHRQARARLGAVLASW